MIGTIRRRTPDWTIAAATCWSLAYGIAGIYWAAGGAGFPFGAHDTQAADNGMLLASATPQVAGPMIALLGFGGVLVSRAMARSSVKYRTLLIAFGATIAVVLTLVLPEARAVKYMPPLGLLAFIRPAAWGTWNFVLLMLAGFCWAGATLTYWRKTRGDCANCGSNGTLPDPGRAETIRRLGRRVTYVAIVAPWGYAIFRLGWAAGVPIGIPQEFLDHINAANPGNTTKLLELSLAAFAIGGSILTIGLLRPSSETFPRWMIGLAGRRVPPAFPITFAGLVAFDLTAFGLSLVRDIAPFYASGRMSEGFRMGVLYPLPSLAILVWGVSLGLATAAFYQQHRRPCELCNRNLASQAGRT